MAIASVGLLMAPGCGSTPLTTSYKIEGTMITTVDKAMQAWSDYVNQPSNKVTQAQVDAVKQAYETYYNTQLSAKGAIDAYIALQSPANSNNVIVATASIGSSAAAVVSIIQSFTTKK